MKSIQEIFPKASKSFIEANHGLSSVAVQEVDKNELQGIVGDSRPRRGVMNKTEQEFAMILEAQKRKGEILRYEFEGITLRFAGVKYTPDFVVFEYGGMEACSYIRLKFIEIKGGYTKGKFERAVERFRHAKTYWPEFTFELHQRTKEGWKQII